MKKEKIYQIMVTLRKRELRKKCGLRFSIWELPVEIRALDHNRNDFHADA